MYTPSSPLLSGAAPDGPALTAAWLRLTAQSPHPAAARAAQADAYVAACAAVGLDPVIVLAQIVHETAALTSWWVEAPRHNPAGINVTGATAPKPQPGYVFNPSTGRYHRGTTYPSLTAAVEPHLARLLAYACTPADLAGGPHAAARRRLIATAPSFPRPCLGTAPALAALGQAHNPVASCGWAWPGEHYGAQLALWANRIAAQLAPVDPWAAWGTAYALPAAERGHGIPQAWLADGQLGAACSEEIAIPLGAVRLFMRGAVIWYRDTNTTKVLR